MLPDNTQRAVDLAREKGASNWLKVIPLKAIAYSIYTLERVYPLMLCSISEAKPMDDPSGKNTAREQVHCEKHKEPLFVSKKNITCP